MRNKLGLIILSILLSTTFAIGQQPSAVEKLEKLRLELIDVQGTEEALRERSHQLDEEIKPENIARSLAGVGSTKPEELREYRRRQLELEKKRVLLELDTIVAKRVSLESAIRTAEVQAYHESANPPDAINQSFVSSLLGGKALLIGLAGGVIAIMGGAVFFIRRLKKTR